MGTNELLLYSLSLSVCVWSQEKSDIAQNWSTSYHRGTVEHSMLSLFMSDPLRHWPLTVNQPYSNQLSTITNWMNMVQDIEFNTRFVPRSGVLVRGGGPCPTSASPSPSCPHPRCHPQGPQRRTAGGWRPGSAHVHSRPHPQGPASGPAGRRQLPHLGQISRRSPFQG